MTNLLKRIFHIITQIIKISKLLLLPLLQYRILHIIILNNIFSYLTYKDYYFYNFANCYYRRIKKIIIKPIKILDVFENNCILLDRGHDFDNQDYKDLFLLLRLQIETYLDIVVCEEKKKGIIFYLEGFINSVIKYGGGFKIVIESLIMLKILLFFIDFTNTDLVYGAFEFIINHELCYWGFMDTIFQNRFETMKYIKEDFMKWNGGMKNPFSFILKDFLLIAPKYSLDNLPKFVYSREDFSLFCKGVFESYFENFKNEVEVLDFLSLNSVKSNRVIFHLPSLTSPIVHNKFYFKEVNGISINSNKLINLEAIDGFRLGCLIKIILNQEIKFNFDSKFDVLDSTTKISIEELNCSLKGFLVLGDNNLILEGHGLKNTTYKPFQKDPNNFDQIFNVVEAGKLIYEKKIFNLGVVYIDALLGQYGIRKDFNLTGKNYIGHNCDIDLKFKDNLKLKNKKLKRIDFPFYVRYNFKDFCGVKGFGYRHFFDKNINNLEESMCVSKTPDERVNMLLEIYFRYSEHLKEENKNEEFNFEIKSLEIIMKEIKEKILRESQEGSKFSIYICKGDRFKTDHCECFKSNLSQVKAVGFCLCVNKLYKINNKVLEVYDNYYPSLPKPYFINKEDKHLFEVDECNKLNFRFLFRFYKKIIMERVRIVEDKITGRNIYKAFSIRKWERVVNLKLLYLLNYEDLDIKVYNEVLNRELETYRLNQNFVSDLFINNKILEQIFKRISDLDLKNGLGWILNDLVKDDVAHDILSYYTVRSLLLKAIKYHKFGSEDFKNTIKDYFEVDLEFMIEMGDFDWKGVFKEVNILNLLMFREIYKAEKNVELKGLKLIEEFIKFFKQGWLKGKSGNVFEFTYRVMFCNWLRKTGYKSFKKIHFKHIHKNTHQKENIEKRVEKCFINFKKIIKNVK